MLKTRIYRWCWIVALLVGLGTWWCVRAWLSPHISFEMTYQSKDALKFAASMLPQFPNVDEAHVHPRWDVRIWDSSNRYLLNMLCYHGDLPKYYDLIDMHTGKMIVQQRRVGTNIDFWHHLHEKSTSLPSGDIFGIKYQSNFSPDDSTREQLARKLLNGYVSFRVDRRRQNQPVSVVNTEVWSWNALTNEEKYHRTFPDRSTVEISSDSSTLLEVERVTAMLPGFLLPTSIPNILAAQVTAEIGLQDLAVMRVWALPDLKPRCTVIKPWMHRQGMAELSADGAYLVLCDSNLPVGFISKHLHQYEFSHHSHRIIVDCYATDQLGMQIYDTRTGELWWEKSDYTGVYLDYRAVGQDLVQFSKMRESLLVQPDLLLHIPTKRLLEVDNCPSAELLSDGMLQYASTDMSGEPGYEIRVAGRDGTTYSRGKVHTWLQFIRSTPQYVRSAKSENKEMLPEGVRDFLRKWDRAAQWLDSYSGSVTVFDHAANRPLFKMPVGESAYVRMQITKRWLVVKQEGEDCTKISVLSVPFPSWSPWWAYVSGLVFAIIAKRLLTYLDKKAKPVSSKRQ